MQSDMQGIIEQQQISRRHSSVNQSPGTIPAKRKKNGAADRARVPGRPPLNGSSTAARLKHFEPGATVLRRVSPDGSAEFPERTRAPRSTAHQRPVRRSRRIRLRRLIWPARAVVTRLVEPATGAPPLTHTATLPFLTALPLALFGLALVLNTVFVSRSIITDNHSLLMPAVTDSVLLDAPSPVLGSTDGEPLSIDPTPYEKIRRAEYVVQPGDTISEIALAFDLDPGTILSVNPIGDVRRLLPGTTLSIPNRDGLLHAVAPGESISGIAESYSIDVAALLDANDVESTILQVGDVLFVPGVSMPDQDYLLAIGELFQWPVRSFTFTSGYGMRVHPISGLWHMHTGIDLANRTGTPVLAAGAGTVAHVEDQGGNYGKVMIIDHGNGYRTLYAHLDSFGARYGQYVAAGQRIGTMGSTGRSTGPHLHFSVFRGSRPIDPLSQLGDR